MEQWITAPWRDVGMAMLSLVVVYAAVIAYTRVFGLRSFSKMSGADFAMTIAVGSLLGSSVVTASPPLAVALPVTGGIFAMQWLIARVRERLPRTQRVIDNTPIVLMAHGEMLHDHMRAAGVSAFDLRAKLREANVLCMADVRAVVFETTGDVSVLHDSGGTPLDPALLEGVRGADRVARGGA